MINYLLLIIKLINNMTTRITANNITNTGVVAGIYGNSTTIPIVTVNSQGQITSLSNVAIVAGASTDTATVKKLQYGLNILLGR